ncbi:MAG: hypothetical protein ACKVH8_17540 [Pirellulales bacterium]
MFILSKTGSPVSLAIGVDKRALGFINEQSKKTGGCPKWTAALRGDLIQLLELLIVVV